MLLVFFFDAFGKDGPYVKWAKANNATVENFYLTTASGQVTDVPVKQMTAPNGDCIRIEYYSDISPTSNAWYWFEQRIQNREFMPEEVPVNPHDRPSTHTIIFGDPTGGKSTCLTTWPKGPNELTLAVDSITFMELAARMYAKHVTNKGSKEPRQWFAASTDALEYNLLVQLNGLPCNVVILAHIDTSKDEINGTMLRNPAAPGRLTSRNLLTAGYAEQYRAYVQRDGTERLFLLQTLPDSRFNCGTQINAPDPCWQDWESLWINW